MQGRRNFSAEFKARVVLEILTGAKSVAQVAQQYSIKPELLSRWKSDFVANAPKLFENGSATRATDPQAERIAELERLVGRMTLEMEILKKGSAILNGELNRNGGQS
jgi:transposase-like protein